MAVMTRYTNQELSHMHFKDMLLWAGLHKDHLDLFGEWAFGKDFKDIRTSQMPAKWNVLHGDIFKIEPSGHMPTDITKIVNAFQDHLVRQLLAMTACMTPCIEIQDDLPTVLTREDLDNMIRRGSDEIKML